MTHEAPHRWDNAPTKGYLVCLRCGLEVRESDRQRGGLGPCERGRWKLKKEAKSIGEGLVVCGYCKKTVPKTIYCVRCGNKLGVVG